MKFTKEQTDELLLLFPARFPEVKPEQMVLMEDTDWNDYTLKELTCINHPLSRYMTKNVVSRTIHFVQAPSGLPGGLDSECDCPFNDLRFVKED